MATMLSCVSKPKTYLTGEKTRLWRNFWGRWKCGSGKCRSGKCGSTSRGL